MSTLHKPRRGNHFFAPGTIERSGHRARRIGARLHFALQCLAMLAVALVIGVLAGLAQAYGWAP